MLISSRKNNIQEKKVAVRNWKSTETKTQNEFANEQKLFFTLFVYTQLLIRLDLNAGNVF